VVRAKLSRQLVRSGDPAGFHRTEQSGLRGAARNPRSAGQDTLRSGAAAHRRGAQAPFHRQRRRASPHVARQTATGKESSRMTSTMTPSNRANRAVTRTLASRLLIGLSASLVAMLALAAAQW